MKKLIVFLILILCSISFADDNWYVDPDAGGAGTGGDNDGVEEAQDWTDAYTSLNAAVTAKAADIVTATKKVTFHCRSSAGTDDTTNVVFSTSWTTSATYYVTVIQEDFPTDGVYDNTKYVLSATNATAVYSQTGYVKFQNVQILVTETSGNAVGFLAYDNETHYTIDGCIIKGVCSGSGENKGIHTYQGESTVLVTNSIIYGFVSGANNENYGIWGQSCSSINAYNCIIEGNRRGVRRDGGTVTVKNSAVFNNSDDDFLLTITVDYCASDDGDGTNGIDWTAEATDWTAAFNDYANGDFSLKTGSDLIGAGTDLSGSGVTTDILGTARTAPYDIGAFKYTATGGSTTSTRKYPRVININ